VIVPAMGDGLFFDENARIASYLEVSQLMTLRDWMGGR
jgi:hypothetical protein